MEIDRVLGLENFEENTFRVNPPLPDLGQPETERCRAIANNIPTETPGNDAGSLEGGRVFPGGPGPLTQRVTLGG